MGDFIAENFIIIVIVIGGILSLLKNKSNPEEEEKQTAKNPATAGSARRSYPSRTHKGGASVDTNYAPSASNKHASVSMEEQKQMEQLQKRMGGSSMAVVEERNDHSHHADIEVDEKGPGIVRPHEHNEFRKEIKGKLNKKGLIDSIVMAEVLGPPRAKKPYSSIVSRKIK